MLCETRVLEMWLIPTGNDVAWSYISPRFICAHPLLINVGQRVRMSIVSSYVMHFASMRFPLVYP